MDKQQAALIPFEDEERGFEAFAKSNGKTWWYASDLARMLGYSGLKPFSKAIQRAMTTCVGLDIAIADNFQEEDRVVDGATCRDYRLTRFSCYLTVMNADISKPLVAKAQGYFARLAEAFREYFQHAENVQRLLDRGEISIHEKSLSGAVYQAGVENYAFFQDAGYRGMYNMRLNQLKEYKGFSIPNRPLLDFMGSAELAANRFRITQTEEKIRLEKIKGQTDLENAHLEVGKEVRHAMQRISGQKPEDLPLAGDIRQVKTGIKRTQREFGKMDRVALAASKKTPAKKRP